MASTDESQNLSEDPILLILSYNQVTFRSPQKAFQAADHSFSERFIWLNQPYTKLLLLSCRKYEQNSH